MALSIKRIRSSDIKLIEFEGDDGKFDVIRAVVPSLKDEDGSPIIVLWLEVSEIGFEFATSDIRCAEYNLLYDLLIKENEHVSE